MAQGHDGEDGLAAALQVVEDCYVRSRPFYSNLLDDFGATDAFLVDGDCLLLEFISASRVDWASGGQFLQLRAHLEQFVQAINSANTTGLRWWVVFFDANAALLDPAARLARTLAAEWLPGALSVPVLRLSSWWGQDFLSWLAAVRPAMLMLTDLPQQDPLASGGGGEGGQGLVSRQQLLQAYVVHSTAHGLQAAFLREMRFPEGFAFGFRTGWRSKVQQDSGGASGGIAGATIVAARSIAEAFAHSATAAAQPGGSFAVDRARIPTVALASSEPGGEWLPGGERASVGALCCGILAALAPPSALTDLLPLFTRAWCLHEFLCRRLPLRERALRMPGRADTGAGGHSWARVRGALAEYVSSFHAVAAALLGPGGGTGSRAAALDASMADWLDGRLLHCIVLGLWEGWEPALAPPEQAELRGLCQLVQQASQAAGAASGTQGPALLDSLVQPAAPSPAGPEPQAGRPLPAEERQVRLFPVQENALVEAVAGEAGSQHLQQHSLDSEAVRSTLEGLQPSYTAAFHWHSGQPIDAAQLEVSEREEQADLAGMTLEEIVAGSGLPQFIRRRAAQQLERVEHLVKGHLLREAAEVRERAVGYLVKKAAERGRSWQMYYRHLEMYAKSLDPTKFSRPAPAHRTTSSSGGRGAAGAASKERKRPDAGAGGGKKSAPKKADLIKQQNLERLAAKQGDSAEEQWGSVRRRLEASIASAGWSADVAADVDALLASLATKSPATYLAAAAWKLSHLRAAWAALVRQQGPGTGEAGPGALGSAPAALAVQLWSAASDLVRRGLLAAEGRPGVPEEARLGAGEECVKGLAALGLAACAQHVAGLLGHSAGHRAQQPKKVSKRPPGVSNDGGDGGGGGLGLSDVRFQLRHCGHLLPHDVPAERDPRVESFNPDLWQRKVLDAIDSGASALIVAPTSSGKTFISSYCINRVVRAEGDAEGLVVFVAPTKALVNQVAAQVYKDFEGTAGVSTGVFTRDYRHNVEGCRILVTVPACLEILLLSPTSQDWVRRVRYVILDEVHCMREVHLGEGGVRDGSGSVWEHILLLLRCPFLALSATIGNPDEFCSWLRNVKRLQAEQDADAGREAPANCPGHYEVELIKHSTRHSDLRLHTYTPRCLQPVAGGQGPEGAGNGEMEEDHSLRGWQLPLSELVAGLEGQAASAGLGSRSQPVGSLVPARVAAAVVGEGVVGECGALARMNPLAALEVPDLEQGCFPPELSLEPIDVEQLHDSMRSALLQQQGSGDAVWHTQAAVELAALAPEAYFAAQGAGAGGSPFLTRRQVREYEAALKALLLRWAGEEGPGRRVAESVLRGIRGSAYMEPPEYSPRLQGGQALAGVVLDLLRAGMLPALVFNFERRTCHTLAEALVEYLEACEAQDRVRNAAKYEARREEAERAARAAKASRDKKPSRRRGGEEDGAEEGISAESTPAYDEDAVVPEFSLAGKSKSLSAAEVEDLIRGTVGSAMPADDPLVRGLRRGVGIHHGGLTKAYRQVVEILFRAGHLRVVIATGTLAFGIHMPCRTVVFAGDHLFLSALQFRQMMGRAGRRGFDPLGNVVFFGVGPRKIRSLLISPVPRLLGHFPLTLTMCLRALALYNIVAAGSSKSSSEALVGKPRKHSGAQQGAGPEAALVRDTLACLFKRPFYAEANPGLLQQVQHLFRFSAEYLVRTGAVGLRGEPVGLAGLLCHLHWADPANLALASLLRSGALDEICRAATPGMSPDAFEPIAERMLVVLSHLFMRLPLHRGALLQPERFLRSPSKVVLEPLPAEVQAAMDAHNRDALRLFVDYVRCYVESLGEGSQQAGQDVLPLSGIALPVAPSAAGGGPPGAPASPAPSPPGSLQALLGSLRVGYCVSSPFAALSGRGDEFDSMDDLVRSVRAGVLLDIAVLPAVSMVDRHGQEVPLNRYVLDYWKHGQKAALVEANGLREGDAWQALSGFVDVLRVVTVALGQLLPPGAFHPVVYALERLAGEYQERFGAFNAARRAGLGS